MPGLPAERERIGLDTNLFIYFLEAHPRYGSWCTSLFDLIERGHNPAVTSTVALLELLVQPYRDQKEELAQKIFALVSSYPKLDWVPVHRLGSLPEVWRNNSWAIRLSSWLLPP